MYALVGGLLSVIIVAALILALIGQLSFTPFELILSALVFCGVSFGVSFLLGKLYGIYSHLRSALITGMILTLLFTPSSDTITLLHYGLIAVVAQASKFVVTFRGRHIFNPAAFGAFAGALSGLQFASWWVGTPVLFPLVFAGTLLLLIKTRLLEAGLVFLVISIAIISLSDVELWTILSSWPIVFLAGYMLTEPSTLPPKRTQLMIVAVIVALLVSIPFQIGSLRSSPEFALIIGNVVAFGIGYMYRRNLGLVFESKHTLTPTVDEFVFRSSAPVHFEPGQYIELTIPHSKQDPRGTRRYFSLTGTPGKREIRLGVKFYKPSSSLKVALQTLKPGTPIQSTGILGDFVLPKSVDHKLLFIAGGIGITPFISMIRSGIDTRDVVLLYTANDDSEFAYRDEIDASNVTAYYHSSRLTEETLKSYVKDLDERSVYISGPPAMVAATKTLAKAAKSVKTDHFSGY